MIKVRKIKSNDAAQRNSAKKYAIEFDKEVRYFTEKELIELNSRLGTFTCNHIKN